MSLLTLEWQEESGEKLRERSVTYLPHIVRSKEYEHNWVSRSQNVHVVSPRTLLRERSVTYLPHCVRFLSRRACRSRSAAISAARLWTCAQLISNSALRLFSRSRS